MTVELKAASGRDRDLLDIGDLLALDEWMRRHNRKPLSGNANNLSPKGSLFGISRVLPGLPDSSDGVGRDDSGRRA